jgi:ubiquinol-cytochrome c reductase cytochrome c1 subunit
MVRPIAFLAGLGFAGILLYSLLMGAIAYIGDPPKPTVEHEFHLAPKELELASDGPLGKFDRQQLQRGFQVFKEVCSACHSLHQVAFRDLTEIGFSEPEVKAIAKSWATETPSINPETASPRPASRPRPTRSRAPMPTKSLRAPRTTTRCRPISR